MSLSVLVDLWAVEALVDDSGLPFCLPLGDCTQDVGLVLLRFATYGDAHAYKDKYHNAEDYAQPAVTPVYAVADGHISFSGWMRGYGWLIVIDHPRANLYSLHGHLSPSRWHRGLGCEEG